MEKEINILLVDDHLVVRKGIELIINNNYLNAVVHNAENYSEAIEILNVLDVNLVILDIIINGIEDIKIMKKIKSIQNNTKILIFSCHEEEYYGLRYIKNGADGDLNKYSSESEIIEALKNVLEYGCFYSDEIKSKLISNKSRRNYINPIDSLSNREFEIAKMLINGCGNLEIANKLNIQMSTVSTYKNRVFEKLSINNIVALSDIFKEVVN